MRWTDWLTRLPLPWQVLFSAVGLLLAYAGATQLFSDLGGTVTWLQNHFGAIWLSVVGEVSLFVGLSPSFIHTVRKRRLKRAGGLSEKSLGDGGGGWHVDFDGFEGKTARDVYDAFKEERGLRQHWEAEARGYEGRDPSKWVHVCSVRPAPEPEGDHPRVYLKIAVFNGSDSAIRFTFGPIHGATAIFKPDKIALTGIGLDAVKGQESGEIQGGAVGTLRLKIDLVPDTVAERVRELLAAGEPWGFDLPHVPIMFQSADGSEHRLAMWHGVGIVSGLLGVENHIGYAYSGMGLGG